ncbi:116_t:CDS:10 [Paraglomus occultum]|uniref:116_t:CDS:1 n=1 Tax=Paraglomus occultum TaxID=144539 RepID=A0A9N8ZWJ6_9GLOM|nr:116_t:CDS:10 [Paraglomus occultum]
MARMTLYKLDELDEPKVYENEMHEAYISYDNLLKRGNTEVDVQNALLDKRSDDKKYKETMYGILFAILTGKDSTPHFNRMCVCVRDQFGVIVDRLRALMEAADFHRLRQPIVIKMLQLIEKLIEMDAKEIDKLVEIALRQAAGSNTTQANIEYCDTLLGMLERNRIKYLYKRGKMLRLSLYTYLRLIRDHLDESFDDLRRREINFCIRLMRDQFHHCKLIGRDLVRLLIDVASITEFRDFWRDLLYNPQILDERFDGLKTLVRMPTQSVYLTNRISPHLERLLTAIFKQDSYSGYRRRWQWLRDKYFSRPGSQYLAVDIIRYIVCVIHPTNEMLRSNLVKRYQIIAELISITSDEIIRPSALLALFYDWLFWKAQDNIMNIEPAILLIMETFESRNWQYCQMLIEFLRYEAYGFCKPLSEDIKKSVDAAMETVLTQRRSRFDRFGKLATNKLGNAFLRIGLVGKVHKKLCAASTSNTPSKAASNISSNTLNTPSSALPAVPPPSTFSSTPITNSATPVPTNNSTPTPASTLPSTPAPGSTLNSATGSTTGLVTGVGFHLAKMVVSPATPSSPVPMDVDGDPPKSYTNSTSVTKSSKIVKKVNNGTSLSSSIVPPAEKTSKDASLWIYGKNLEQFRDATSLSVQKSILPIILDTFEKHMVEDAPKKISGYIVPAIRESMTKSDLFTAVMDKLWSLDSESSKSKMLELLRLIGDVDNGHALVSFQVLLSCLRKAQEESKDAFFDAPNLKVYKDLINYQLEMSNGYEDLKFVKKQRVHEDFISLHKSNIMLFQRATFTIMEYLREYCMGEVTFVLLLVSKITPILSYELQIKLARNQCVIFGDKYDEILVFALDWDPIEQYVLFQILNAEVGGRVDRVEKMLTTSSILRALDRSENPEPLIGLLDILRTVPPTSLIISSIMYLMSNASDRLQKQCSLEFVITAFQQWYRNSPETMRAVLTNYMRELSEGMKNNNTKESTKEHAGNLLDVIISWYNDSKAEITENFLKNDEFYSSIKRITQLLGKQLLTDWLTIRTPETNTEAEDGK